MRSTLTATVDKPDALAGVLVIDRSSGPKIHIEFKARLTKAFKSNSDGRRLYPPADELNQRGGIDA